MAGWTAAQPQCLVGSYQNTVVHMIATIFNNEFLEGFNLQECLSRAGVLLKMTFADMEWSNTYFLFPLFVREEKNLGLQVQ